MFTLSRISVDAGGIVIAAVIDGCVTFFSLSTIDDFSRLRDFDLVE